MRRLPAAAAVALVVIACSRTPAPRVEFTGGDPPAAVEVHGLPGADLRELGALALSPSEWQHLFDVRVEGAPLPMQGRYTVADGVVRFTPAYGFDPGRTFAATFDPTRIPGAASVDGWRSTPLLATVTPSRVAHDPSTVVRQVYPSGPIVPANMLRFYFEFSDPMGRGTALEHIRLEESSGSQVVDPFLPLDADLWSPDRTRFTLFFDPGRVKRDIKPNRDLGRALIPGRSYALVIDGAWFDGREAPLARPHRHVFQVGEPIERAIDHAQWSVEPPRAGTRDALVVRFPWALDYGLLHRALGVRRDGADLAGAVVVDEAETRWTFRPDADWQAGDYRLIVLTILEDPAGNRLGRAFEVTQAAGKGPDQIELPFLLR
jgi:hypothetical protein